METVVAIFIVLSFLAAVLYSFLMLMLMLGWLSLEGNGREEAAGELQVSVLIPARNEAQNITACIRSITSQQYNMENVEIIVIDDCSEDDTVKLVKQQQDQPGARIKLIELNGLGKCGKKEALTEGIKAADSNVIITTDADTTRGPQWLASIEKFYNKHRPKMIIAPVAYTKEAGWFGKMQSVEFAGLVATAGGAAGIGMAMVCNGANLVFEKEAFGMAGGYSGTEDVPSGDDVMLMTRISRMFPGGIKFLKDREAIAYTMPCASLRQFLNQRIRWASKNRKGYNNASLAAGIIVLAMNSVVPAALLLSVFFHEVLMFSLILLTVKCIIDFLFLFLAASFFEKRRFLFLFIPQQLLYMLYISTTGMLAIFSGYEWKGRRHR